jgi:Cu(I)/Ag(I) efflux system protein CusF
MKDFLFSPRSALALAIFVSVGVGGLCAAIAPARAQNPVHVAQTEKPTGRGTINAIDAVQRKLNITHGPVAALNWPGMTMDFAVAPGADIGALKPGAKIVFTLGRGPDGGYVLDEIKPAK